MGLRRWPTSASRVRAADQDRLASVLGARGGSIEREEEALLVSGLSGEEIGEVALAEGIALHELAPRQSSLEERFLEVMGAEEDPA